MENKIFPILGFLLAFFLTIWAIFHLGYEYGRNSVKLYQQSKTFQIEYDCDGIGRTMIPHELEVYCK